MSIKVLLLDMDGTTLEKNQVTISQRNMNAIEKAIDKGIQVVPCTGRVLDMYPPQLFQMSGIRYCVTGHGARAVDRAEGRTIYQNLISPADAARVCQIFEELGVYAEIAAQNTIYIEKAVDDRLDEMPVPAHHVWYMKDQHCQIAVEKPSRYLFDHCIGVEKVNIYGLPKPLQQLIYDQVTATGCIKHTREGAGPDLEFSCKTLDKAQAVDAILKEVGASLDECMIMGDSSSDYDMIQEVGLGIAMGNAPDWIKAVAKDVAPRYDEDGVAAMIEKYLL